MREASIERKTRETDIKIKLNIDGNGNFKGSSGIGFFDHMLNSFTVHARFDIGLSCSGDLHVDCHHTIEDIGISLGMAFKEVLDDKSGISRFGNSFIPMDESLAQSTVDVSGRPFLIFNADFKEEKVGDMDSCMVVEFFRAFAFNAGITLHINMLYGRNTHHMIEAIFKAVAYSLKESVKPLNTGEFLSTKGVL